MKHHPIEKLRAAVKQEKEGQSPSEVNFEELLTAWEKDRQTIQDIHWSLSGVCNDATNGTNWKILIDNIKTRMSTMKYHLDMARNTKSY